jgi:hypothetical protein
MKKLLLASFLASLVGVAQAGNWYSAVEGETGENRVTKAETIGTGLIVGYKEGDWQYSGKMSTSQAEWGNGSITTSYEGRIKRSFDLGFVKPYLQGRLGDRVTSSKDFTYYALDTGVVLPVSKQFDLDFSYRYRNAFNADNNFQTDRYGIEGKVKLTSQDSLGLRYTQSYGDSETNAWRLQYTHSF